MVRACTIVPRWTARQGPDIREEAAASPGNLHRAVVAHLTHTQ